MRGVNRVQLIGNLGRDPDVQYLEGNIAVAKFPLATTETFKDKTGQSVSQTEWHTVVLWRGLAELAQKYLHKGSLVYIEGRLKTRNWEDKEKVKRQATEIVGDNLVMLDKRKDGEFYAMPGADGMGHSSDGIGRDSVSSSRDGVSSSGDGTPFSTSHDSAFVDGTGKDDLRF
jgi:single-strand DNA-binding protein